MTIGQVQSFLSKLKLTGNRKIFGEEMVKESLNRLGFFLTGHDVVSGDGQMVVVNKFVDSLPAPGRVIRPDIVLALNDKPPLGRFAL